MTFKIIYDPNNGQTVPDGLVESFVKDYVNAFNGSITKEMKVTVGTEAMFTRFRLAIAKQELNHQCVNFFVQNKPIKISMYGGILDAEETPFQNNIWISEMLNIMLSGKHTLQLIQNSKND